jgi:rubredoxin
MKVYVCSVCGFEYEEENGLPEENVEAGTKWEDVPEDFVCPACGAGKDMFAEQE